jgi:hypothetical protein
MRSEGASAQKDRAANAGSVDSPPINSERRFCGERIGLWRPLRGAISPTKKRQAGSSIAPTQSAPSAKFVLWSSAAISSKSAASVGSLADDRFGFRRRTRRSSRKFTRFDSARRQHVVVLF